MKLSTLLNEGDYSKLAEWETAAKKLGYTVTKDAKTGTYHAWDKTSHKGRFNAPTGKGHLTEGLFDRFKKKATPVPQRMPIDADQRAFIKKYFPARHNADIVYSPGKYVLPDSVRAVSGRGIVNFTNYDGKLTAHVAYHKSADDAHNPKATPLTHFDEPITGPADMEKLVKMLAEGLTEAAAPRKGTVAWEREQQRKKKERDPEETKRIEKIGDKNHQVGNAKVTHDESVSEADKHSFFGKIQRHHELKKKVDSTWRDAVDAEKHGDKEGASKSFKKHVRYTNLERPGTWRDVKEAAQEDMTGCKCPKCKKGTYQETSQHDDMDGVLHCTNCGMKVDRYKSESVVQEGAYEIGYDAFLADKTKCPYQPGSDDAADWNLGWEAAQARERSNEGVEEGFGDIFKRRAGSASSAPRESMKQFTNGAVIDIQGTPVTIRRQPGVLGYSWESNDGKEHYEEIDLRYRENQVPAKVKQIVASEIEYSNTRHERALTGLANMAAYRARTQNGVEEGFGDFVKGVKRKIAGKADPKEVEYQHGFRARQAIDASRKFNNQSAYDNEKKMVDRYHKVHKVVNKEGVESPNITFAQSTLGSWSRIDILVNGDKQFIAAKTVGPGFWSIYTVAGENIDKGGSNKKELKAAVLDYLSSQDITGEGTEETLAEATEQSLQKKIQAKRDALGLAREKRKASGNRQQGTREIKLQAEIDKLGDELRQLSKQRVTEAGNKPVTKSHLGTGDTRSPRELKTQMQSASDEFVRDVAGTKTGPFHSKVAKMQGKLAKSELRRREQHMTEGVLAEALSILEAYTGHFNDDDWYEVDTKSNTVIRHAGGHSAYRSQTTLPNGNTVMRGMKAKHLQSVAEGKEDKISQLKKDYATAVHWSKNETSPQKREAARQQAEKIKGHLEKQYKQGVAEGTDPQDKLSKWTVTYDTYGSNKDVPLKKGATKTVYADTADAACAEIKKLVGGRNHKAECVRKPIAESDVGVDPISHRTYSKTGVPMSNTTVPDAKRRKANHDHFMALAAHAKRAEDKEHYVQKAKAALGESTDEYEDEYEDEQPQEFYVVFQDFDGNAPTSIGKIEQDGGNWEETKIWGQAPMHWGERGGSYMSYLQPEQIMQWLNKDYDDYNVTGPFDTFDEARAHAEIDG